MSPRGASLIACPKHVWKLTYSKCELWHASCNEGTRSTGNDILEADRQRSCSVYDVWEMLGSFGLGRVVPHWLMLMGEAKHPSKTPERPSRRATTFPMEAKWQSEAAGMKKQRSIANCAVARLTARAGYHLH